MLTIVLANYFGPPICTNKNRVSGGPQVPSIVKSQIVQTSSGRPLRRGPAAATVRLARTGSPGASLPVTRAGPPPGGPVPGFNS